jgi:hypothetical protein
MGAAEGVEENVGEASSSTAGGSSGCKPISGAKASAAGVGGELGGIQYPPLATPEVARMLNSKLQKT